MNIRSASPTFIPSKIEKGNDVADKGLQMTVYLETIFFYLFFFDWTPYIFSTVAMLSFWDLSGFKIRICVSTIVFGYSFLRLHLETFFYLFRLIEQLSLWDLSGFEICIRTLLTIYTYRCNTKHFCISSPLSGAAYNFLFLSKSTKAFCNTSQRFVLSSWKFLKHDTTAKRYNSFVL